MLIGQESWRTRPSTTAASAALNGAQVGVILDAACASGDAADDIRTLSTSSSEQIEWIVAPGDAIGLQAAAATEPFSRSQNCESTLPTISTARDGLGFAYRVTGGETLIVEGWVPGSRVDAVRAARRHLAEFERAHRLALPAGGAA